MSSIKHIDDLREKVLDIFEELDLTDPDIQKAGIAAKLSETVILGLKTQLEYSRLLGIEPNIPFLEGTNKQIINKKLLK